MTRRPIVLATRGSPLALAQTQLVRERCALLFPESAFDVRVLKTTGDTLQQASLSHADPALPKGLFTKELEIALLAGDADLAIHSLKDLPTDLPENLVLSAVLERADPRDVLVFRVDPIRARATPLDRLHPIAHGATVATSSPRRRVQLHALRPDLVWSEIRGNVGTRLRKVAAPDGPAATLLAAAGLGRLGYTLVSDEPDATLAGTLRLRAPAGLEPVPAHVRALVLPVDVMVPAVGQAAIGIEVSAGNAAACEISQPLNHIATWQAVEAERAFLRSMGGGCQAPMAAHGTVGQGRLRLAGVRFAPGGLRRAEVRGDASEPVRVGQTLSSLLADGIAEPAA